MIKSFSNLFTEKILQGVKLTKKERKLVGSLNVANASERLVLRPRKFFSVKVPDRGLES